MNGRYYYGTISGMFWLGVQSSFDIEDITSSAIRYDPQSYFGCECLTNNNSYSHYCRQCNNSYEQHYEKIKETHKIQKGYPLYELSNFVHYDLKKEDCLLEVENTIKKLEEKHKFLKEMKLIFDTSEHYDYDEIYDGDEWSEGKDVDIDKCVARWCLAKQIHKAFQYNNYITIECEI